MTPSSDPSPQQSPDIGVAADPDVVPEAGVHQETSEAGVIDQARALVDSAAAAFLAGLEFVRAEFRLARHSLRLAVMHAVALVVLAIGTWLSMLALVATGIQVLTGSWLAGVASVLLLNGVGMAWVVWKIRVLLRDASMPRTRQLLARQSMGASGAAKTGDSREMPQ